MFTSEFGKNQTPDCFQGTTLVLPSTAIGLSPHIAMDMFILNQNMTRVGFYTSEYIAPMLVNDSLTTANESFG